MMAESSRVNLVLPKDLWERVKRMVPEGQRSHLVAEAIEAEIHRRERLQKLERLRQFQEYMRNKYGELPSCAGDIQEMREGRDGEVAGLR